MLGFTSIDNMQEEFCSNNYYEMLAVVHVFMLGRVHGNYQDMFLEQRKLAFGSGHDCKFQSGCA